MPGNIINLSPDDILKWPQPNYVDPYRRTWMPEYAGVLYGVATLMVGTRLWLRTMKRSGGFGLDDTFLILSWVGLSWFTVLAILGSEKYMTSRHIWNVPVDSYTDMTKITWIAELAFLLTGCLVKVSVLLFYRRLVRDTFSAAWKWAVICAIAFTVAYTLAFILALILNCAPTEAYWEGFNPNYTKNYHCVNTTIINLLSGIMGILGDLYSVALPCIMTRNLTLPMTQKVGLYVVFSLGLLVTAASCVRTYYLHSVGTNSDISWTIFNVFVWAQLELCLSLMCASAPSLRVLFREYFSEPITKVKRSINSGNNRKRSDVDDEIMQRIEESEETLRCDSVVKQVTIESTIREEDGDELTLFKTSSTSTPVRSPADYERFSLQTVEKYRQSGQLMLCHDWPKGNDVESIAGCKPEQVAGCYDHLIVVMFYGI